MPKRIYRCSKCKKPGHNRTSCRKNRTGIQREGIFSKLHRRFFGNKGKKENRIEEKNTTSSISRNTLPCILPYALKFVEPMGKSADGVLDRFYSGTAEPEPMRLSSRTWRKIEKAQSINGVGLTNEQKKIARGFPAVMELLKNAKGIIRSNAVTEAVFSQEFAERLGLSVFVSPQKGITKWNKIISMVNPILKDHNFVGTPHFVYCDPDCQQILLVSGSPNDTDAVLILLDENGMGEHVVEKIEFKSLLAKTGEVNLPPYAEDGRYSPYDIQAWAKEEDKQHRVPYVSMVQEFAGRDQSFDNLAGNNYHMFSPKNVLKAANGGKKAALVVTEDKHGKLMVMRHEDVPKFTTLFGEIRPAGKNPARVWTPKLLMNIICQHGGKHKDGIIIFPSSAVIPSSPRGGNINTISRYKIGSLFFFRSEDATFNSNNISVSLGKIRQLKPTVAVKIDFSKTEESEVRNFYTNMSNN